MCRGVDSCLVVLVSGYLLLDVMFVSSASCQFVHGSCMWLGSLGVCPVVCLLLVLFVRMCVIVSVGVVVLVSLVLVVLDVCSLVVPSSFLSDYVVGRLGVRLLFDFVCWSVVCCLLVLVSGLSLLL